MHKLMLLGAVAAALFASGATFAQNNPSNLEKLGEFKTTEPRQTSRRCRRAAPRPRR
jgi:hypothetical protein